VIGKLDDAMDFQARALQLRSYRQQLLASNVANGDTPHYKAVDFDFATALKNASQGSSSRTRSLAGSAPMHIAGTSPAPSGVQLQYRGVTQASIDGNSVDMDAERAQFVDNAVRYEAAVRFLNAEIRSLATAIKGE
jgi:flagellar basal-body rod protein FlgB